MASSQSALQRQVAPRSKVAIVGFGTVGRSVARLLQNGGSGLAPKLSLVCTRNAQRKRVDWAQQGISWTDAFDDVLASDADIVVELIGGIDPAREFVTRALEARKSVVTANKQLIAHYGAELIDIAWRNGQQIAFGASVAGGIPVLDALREGLAGDSLLRIRGVLNGTCNYILSRIERFPVNFAQALAEAQQAGFAEADPTDDVDGFDARAKLIILARIGLHADVAPDEVDCESIRAIEGVDFEYARDLGCTIRQISRVERNGDEILASVQPALVPLTSPLGQVSGSQNVVVSTGKYGGDTVFGGHGAGGDPTAVAVVSDIIAVASGKAQVLTADTRDPARYRVSADFNTPHYLRFTVRDRPGIIAAIAEVLGRNGINIDAVLQHPAEDKSKLPFVMTLESCSASSLRKALADIGAFDFMVQPVLAMPIIRQEQ